MTIVARSRAACSFLSSYALRAIRASARAPSAAKHSDRLRGDHVTRDEIASIFASDLYSFAV